MRIVEMTLRIPAKRDFLSQISQFSVNNKSIQTHPENAKAAQATQLRERMVL